MKKQITVSAPGKLLLFGDHAVVHDHPCLVTAVDQRMRATVILTNSTLFSLEATDVHIHDYKKPLKEIGIGNIPKGAQFVEIAVKNTIDFVSKTFPEKQRILDTTGIHITTTSDFSSTFGFGSSSASTVCIVYALAALLELQLSKKELFAIAYKTVLDIQGKGSGFDVAAALYGGTINFFTAGKYIEDMQIPELPLIIAYSGIKADTVTLVTKVQELQKTYPEIVNHIFDGSEHVVIDAKSALQKKDWHSVGGLMDINQVYLESLGVSSVKLASLIYAARNAGAYGAKLSGAGGGDCIIVIASEEKRKVVEQAITAVGGQILSVHTNAEGARIEHD